MGIIDALKGKWKRNVNEALIAGANKQYLYEKKRKYFFIFIIIGAVVVLPFSIASHFFMSQYAMLIIDLFLSIGAYCAYILTRKGKLEFALHVMILVMLGALVSSTVITDFFATEPVNYLRLLDTTLVLLPLSVFIGIFSTSTVKLTRYVILYSGVVLAHFVILLVKFGNYDGMLGYYFIWCLIILYLNYWIAKTVININKTAIDVTRAENKKLAVMIDEKVQELASSNETKDKFFQIIAHDLRGPITTSWQLIKILYGSMGEMPTADVRKALSVIAIDMGNLSKLMDDLLLWSRSQSNKIITKAEQVKVCDVVNIALQPLQSYSVRKGVNVSVDLQNDDISVYVDRDMIITVFRNLISNALKFTPTGGEITIRNLITSDVGKVIVSVEDNGIGIDQENIKDIFILDNYTSGKGTDMEVGTGLGLSLCKEFVEKNNGFISVTSKVGKGTSFYVSLPAV